MVLSCCCPRPEKHHQCEKDASSSSSTHDVTMTKATAAAGNHYRDPALASDASRRYIERPPRISLLYTNHFLER
ncbi:hypothetical protein B0O80DRAFT_436946 [Mortierella sp. GBAus27b]|nr:hypothetical protein B0O80DRAFT_436946 [Mortierella sp. GBAus27b]